MLFDLSNYWLFLAVIAAIYVCISTVAQMNVGGKNRLKNLQLEIREIQKTMMEAGKKKDDKSLNEAIERNWKLTYEMLIIQAKLFAVIIGVLLIASTIFPHVEPGMEDDSRFALFDDGITSHCDRAASDGIFSNCLSLPADGQKGAWVLDVYLNSSTGETLTRNATAIYYEGGKPSDIWLQTHQQNGFWDGLLGKKPFGLELSTDNQNYTSGQTVSLHAKPTPSLPEGASLTAVSNSGTFFFIDLPLALPLLNISRIIGSYGVFIFYAFLIGIVLSIARSMYSNITKK